ncbi:hypothetical protein K435DRAFT_703997, partial [Dendrothele bispora CBS 962.96]
MKALKIRDPSYNGYASIQKFDQFTYDYMYLVERHDLDEQTAIKVMPNYLTSKAHEYVLNNVSQNPRGWSLQSVFTAMFEHCFPPTFKEELRRELMLGRQGRKTVEEFSNSLRTGARRFGDITEQSMVQTLWDGVHQYIRVHWRTQGFSPERTKFNRLVKHAKRAE